MITVPGRAGTCPSGNAGGRAFRLSGDERPRYRFRHMTSLSLTLQAPPRTTRDLLIQEGLRSFTSRGFDGASVREIERQAGVGRGLVAHHFGTKDGLWRECVNWLMGRYHAELQKVRENLADVSPLERARVLLRVHVRFVARNPEYTRLLILSGAADTERVRWMIETWIEPSYAFFDRLSGQQRRPDRAAAMAAYAFTGAASMLFTLPVEARAVFGVDPSDEGVVEQFADFLIGWADHSTEPCGGLTSALDRALRAAGLLDVAEPGGELND